MTDTAHTTRGAELHEAIRHGYVTGEHVYLLVDAARNKEFLLTARRKFGKALRWLFSSAAAGQMSEVAPYLVRADFQSRYPHPGSELLDLWANQLGNSNGIILTSFEDATPLQSHLQRLFHVKDETGHRYYFRFYDPRVLRNFLPTCTPDEASEFFGPVRKILVEAQNPGNLLVCDLDDEGVRIRECPLSDEPLPGTPSGARRN